VGKEIKKGFVLICLSLLLLFFDRWGWINWLKTPLQKPFLAAEQKIYHVSLSLKEFLNIFGNQSRPAKKIDQLESQLRQLAGEQNLLATCQQENEQMRKLLGAPLPPQWQFLPAKVVGVGAVFKIDQGSQADVAEGMAVVSENILVGRVAATGCDYSLVQTPQDSEIKIPIIFRSQQDKQPAGRGILENQAGSLVMEKVLQEESLQPGDWVLTSGESGWLPDLLIGEVAEILFKPADVYKRAKVKPLLAYDQLRTVFVIFP